MKPINSITNCSHSSLEVVYLFLPQKEWQDSMFWVVLYLFWQENLQSFIVWVILSTVVCFFPKKVGFSHVFFQRYYNYLYKIFVVIHSFNGTVYFFHVKICSYPIPPTHFLSTCFKTPVNVNQTSYQISYIFRAASIIFKWEQPLELVTFLQKYFFQKT